MTISLTEFEYTGEEILREDLPALIQKRLEGSESSTGIVWNNVGRVTPGVRPSYLVWGMTLDGDKIAYVKGSSRVEYLWIFGKEYKLSKLLPVLEGNFNLRIKFIKHRGDGLGKLGADIEGLGYSDKVMMENLLWEMGVDIPLGQWPENEVFTGEEKRDLAKQWIEYMAREDCK